MGRSESVSETRGLSGKYEGAMDVRYAEGT